MLKIILFFIVTTILLPFAVHAENAGTVISVDAIQLIKISAPDQKAVIKTPDGELRMVGIGDEIGDGKIVEISQNRFVLERNTGAGIEKIIVTIDGGTQKIQRISKEPGKQEPLYGSTLKNQKGK